MEQTPTVGSVIAEWKDCTKCPISNFIHKHVFIETIPANQAIVDILMVGEGPGKGENALGRPFIGASGAFLRDVIRDAGGTDLIFGLDNLVACRPTDWLGGPNRQPNADEIDECKPRLIQIIECVEPIAILSLGNVAQTHMPSALGEVMWNGLTWHIKHTSAVLRHGGKSAPYYSSYVKEFKDLFTKVRLLKKELYRDPKLRSKAG